MSRIRHSLVSTSACLMLGALALVPACAAPAAATEPASGTWLTADGNSKVKIGPCGSVYCASIVWVRPPNEGDDDAYAGKRKFLGTNISTDLHRGDEGNLVGSLLNPENGKSYNVKVKLKNANALEMGGCILGGLLCGSETWTRAAEEVAAVTPPHPRGAKTAAKPAPAARPTATQPAAEPDE